MKKNNLVIKFERSLKNLSYVYKTSLLNWINKKN